MAIPTEDDLRSLLKQAKDADGFYTLVAHKHGPQHVGRAGALAAQVYGSRWVGLGEPQTSAYDRGREAGLVLGLFLGGRALSLVCTAAAAVLAVLLPPRMLFADGNQLHLGFQFLFSYGEGQVASSAIDSGFLMAELMSIAVVGVAWHLFTRLDR